MSTTHELMPSSLSEQSNIEEQTRETKEKKDMNKGEIEDNRIIIQAPELCEKVVKTFRKIPQITRQDHDEIYHEIERHVDFYSKLFESIGEGVLEKSPYEFFYLDDGNPEDKSKDLSTKKRAFAWMCFYLFQSLEEKSPSDQDSEEFWACPHVLTKHIHVIKELPHLTDEYPREIMKQFNIHSLEDTKNVFDYMRKLGFLEFADNFADKEKFRFRMPIMRIVDFAREASEGTFTKISVESKVSHDN